MSSQPTGRRQAGTGADQPDGQRLLGGRYRLERIVGKGAMGRVWAAHDELLNRPVAIKEVDFPPGMPASEVDQLAQRTMREARAVASVSDPHVVTIYDMLSLPHGPAIVMELLTARSLSEILNVDGPMTDSDAATVGLSVASGLLAAHSAGITHRDVKPGNVLICADGRIKLTDFGIARSTGEQSITATGLLLGSPAYISPEVASGRPANAQSDAWGLGAMLFACVQGVPPFDSGTALATLTSVVQDPVPAHPDSGRLGGVIRGLLVKDPATRMTVGMAHQAMLRIAVDSGRLVTHTWALQRPATRRQPGPAATPLQPHPTVRPVPSPNRPPPAPWAGTPAALPPPPWAGASSASLRAIPVVAPERTPGRKVALAAMALLITLIAAAAGYFGVRAIAHLENGLPIAAAQVGAMNVEVAAMNGAVAAMTGDGQPRQPHALQPAN
jgi:serine/threonine protein kinase